MSFPCIVHLDLKGAPWKLEYLQKVILFMKDQGAWGVLIEWEDTFPYTSELVSIGSVGGSSQDGLYTHTEIKNILQFVKDCGLEPIQLVQTIGHMEFVLKHAQFSRLRELPHSPAVLCPTKPESVELVEAIIRQVMDAQPDANYLHIGADEAWHMNVCSDCQQKSSANEHGAAALYLDHIKSVATYIKRKYPRVTVLMWDDMMRNIPVNVLKAYSLGDVVQPVVWEYNVKQHFKLDPQMWLRYLQVFPNMWAASAYKGANGSCQMACSAKRYASNQLAWHHEIEALKGHVNFSGVILTGWSRFDHYATLCELLPVALPSLASCLRIWTTSDGFTNEGVISDSLPLEWWCGHELVGALQAALECRARALAFLDGDQVMTWLNPWQVERRYTSPLQAENMALTAKHLTIEMESVGRQLSSRLHVLTGRRSASELMHTWLSIVQRRLADVTSIANERARASVSITPINGYVT